MHQQAKHLTHQKYRPDIDGLRAIAVLLVVLFHAGLGKTGFIGVDIFFVISGFLISTIIFDNLDSGKFTFFEFYSRRIRRIFPALLLVLLFCAIFGWFTLFSDEYRQLGSHIFYGSLFISNFTLLGESGYFDNVAETKPLLHLWSLAVEEQFYIIWPLLLWFASKKKINFFRIILVVGALSFVFSVFTVYKNKNAAFYLPQSRFWELLIGSILAYFSTYKKHLFQFSEKNSVRINIMSVVGAALIISGIAIITRQKPFPGALALFPTIGAFMIICAGPHAWFNRAILQNKILVWFGLISYPLYLWHWPLLSFARIIESDKPDGIIRAGCVLVSILLAWLTYRFVEKPLRFGQSGKIKTAALIIAMIAIGFIGYECYTKDGIGHRKAIESYERGEEDLMIPYSTRQSDDSCSFKTGLQVDREVVCLANSERPEFLIIGDSHAMSLNSAAYLNKINLIPNPIYNSIYPTPQTLLTISGVNFLINLQTAFSSSRIVL